MIRKDFIYLKGNLNYFSNNIIVIIYERSINGLFNNAIQRKCICVSYDYVHTCNFLSIYCALLIHYIEWKN